MMDWDDAVHEAKMELGYHPEEYVPDWDEVVETAQYILDEWRQEKEDERQWHREQFKKRHQEYMQSEQWQAVRQQVLRRDNFTCIDCNEEATQVHHLYYDYFAPAPFMISFEVDSCISLCSNCHKKRHGLNGVNDGATN